jgi:hypothetical protein
VCPRAARAAGYHGPDSERERVGERERGRKMGRERVCAPRYGVNSLRPPPDYSVFVGGRGCNGARGLYWVVATKTRLRFLLQSTVSYIVFLPVSYRISSRVPRGCRGARGRDAPTTRHDFLFYNVTLLAPTRNMMGITHLRKSFLQTRGKGPWNK